ncbi:TMV resistance protein N-like [Sesbania bispinosa]|nr:TMV resistance protein N-like [Sesbania bispinosa]
MAHDNLQDNLDIYDEARGEVDFPTLLAKYFTKNMLEVMGNLQASKGKDDNGYSFDEELELDSDTDIDNQHMEEEQHSVSLNHQILENCELMNNDKGKDIYERIDDGGQQLVPNAEAYIKTNESTINEVNMEAFYVALEAETTSPSHVQDPQPNNIFVKTRTSEETKKTLHILRDFVSKHFSLLLHPGRSGLMKDTLKYLMSLPPDEGFSLRTRSIILQLSQSFAQWSLDYNNANLRLESTTSDLSKAEKVKDGLEANVKDFREMDMVEKCLCNQLVCLQEKKRELEEKINAIKAEIADFTAQRQMAAKRKIELFHEGRVMKTERDDLRNKVPRLKAEQEWAKITQANIEAEWSKLGEQFIGSTNFEEWI